MLGAHLLWDVTKQFLITLYMYKVKMPDTIIIEMYFATSRSI